MFKCSLKSQIYGIYSALYLYSRYSPFPKRVSQAVVVWPLSKIVLEYFFLVNGSCIQRKTIQTNLHEERLTKMASTVFTGML